MIKYLATAVTVLSFNPCDGHSPRIKISFSLLLVCADKLLPTLKIMIFYPQLKSGIKKAKMNQIQYHIQNKNIYGDQHS